MMRTAIGFIFVLLSQPVFSQERAITFNNADSTTTFLYDKGKQDAKVYYKKYKTPATMTILASTCLMLVSPVAGLSTAIGCSSTPPKTSNLGVPDSLLLNKPAYMEGYRYQAKKIKQRKVWKNWGIGFAINASIIGLLLWAPGQGK